MRGRHALLVTYPTPLYPSTVWLASTERMTPMRNRGRITPIKKTTLQPWTTSTRTPLETLGGSWTTLSSKLTNEVGARVGITSWSTTTTSNICWWIRMAAIGVSNSLVCTFGGRALYSGISTLQRKPQTQSVRSGYHFFANKFCQALLANPLFVKGCISIRISTPSWWI